MKTPVAQLAAFASVIRSDIESRLAARDAAPRPLVRELGPATLGELLAAGLAGELDYLPSDARDAAVELEAAGLRGDLMTAADWLAAEAAITEADLREGLCFRITEAARWAE